TKYRSHTAGQSHASQQLDRVESSATRTFEAKPTYTNSSTSVEPSHRHQCRDKRPARNFDVLAQRLQKGDLYVPSKETRYRCRANYLPPVHIASGDGTDFD